MMISAGRVGWPNSRKVSFTETTKSSVASMSVPSRSNTKRSTAMGWLEANAFTTATGTGRIRIVKFEARVDDIVDVIEFHGVQVEIAFRVDRHLETVDLPS